MGLVSGLVMGTIVGIALMAGWASMMRRRSSKRVTKVRILFFTFIFFFFGSSVFHPGISGSFNTLLVSSFFFGCFSVVYFWIWNCHANLVLLIDINGL